VFHIRFKKMKIIFYILLFLFCFIQHSVIAQIQKLYVEEYYVVDNFDLTDTVFDDENNPFTISPNSKTFRIYIDLEKGYKLKKIYGDNLHPLVFKSETNFFNHKTNGESFGKDIVKNRLEEGVSALDTWLTLGLCTKQATATYNGILKKYDTDNSIIGGINNDGGWSVVGNGLLNNQNIQYPLTQTDGYALLQNNIPGNWFDYGFKDPLLGIDSTIFGSVVDTNSFISYNAGLICNGAQGSNLDSNQVLVAQLTTASSIEFKLNVELEYTEIIGTDTIITNYKIVSSNDSLRNDEIFSRNLIYPFECSCNNTEFLEYDPNWVCADNSKCINFLVLGCTDTSACNFNPKANYNTPGTCCYPGYCNDRRIEAVCEKYFNYFNLFLYPNPSSTKIFVSINSLKDENVSVEILNSTGNITDTFSKNLTLGKNEFEIDLLEYNTGIYLLKVQEKDGIVHMKNFVKN
jgi:hypothetical protein